MAKRFTDTELWDKPWFMELKPKLKCLIKMVRDKCDLCGVWNPNWQLASMYVGEKVSEKELLAIDGGRQFAKIDGGKIFCIGFIQFQYGSLSEKSPVHRKIIGMLDNHKIDYKHPINRVQEKEEEKEEDKESEKEKAKEKGKVHPHLFSESIYFNLDAFRDKLINSKSPYCDANFEFYHEKVANWSSSNSNKKIDWIATAKNFMIGDIEKGKFRTTIGVQSEKKLTENEKQRLRFQQLKETNNDKLAANDNI